LINDLLQIKSEHSFKWSLRWSAKIKNPAFAGFGFLNKNLILIY